MPSSFIALQKKAKIIAIPMLKDALVVIYTFVTLRSDYCNVLLSVLPKNTRSRSMVQNAVTCIACNLNSSTKYDLNCRCDVIKLILHFAKCKTILSSTAQFFF